MTRKLFIAAGSASVGCALLAGTGLGVAQSARLGRVRVRPLSEIRCKPAFLKLCRTRRFASVEDALRAIRGQRSGFELYREP